MEAHIVITGATGIIGSEVAKRLIRSGRKVVLFARSPESAQQKVPGAAGYVRWDADMSDGAWVPYLDGAKAVIHLAGKPLLDARWTEAHKDACYDSRIRGTRSLVKAVRGVSKRPELLLSSSAIGYYGAWADCGDTPEGLLESAQPGTDFLATICHDWEAEALPAEQLGVRVVLLRTGIVLSARSGMLQQMLRPFRYFAGGPVGSGRQCVSWIHIDDEVQIILDAIDNPLYSGPINAVAPSPVTMREFATTLGAVMRRPSLLPIPKIALELLLGEGADYAVKGQKVVPGFLERQGYRFIWPKLREALADLVGTGQ